MREHNSHLKNNKFIIGREEQQQPFVRVVYKIKYRHVSIKRNKDSEGVQRMDSSQTNNRKLKKVASVKNKTSSLTSTRIIVK